MLLTDISVSQDEEHPDGWMGDLTFTEYITNKRLAYACQLLEDKPNWNIDAIAHEAGILSDATFRRLFRKHYNMSPSEYREQRRHSDFVTL
jgi:AraC-like DNA-binding protein